MSDYSYDAFAVRTSAVLTNAYVAGNVLGDLTVFPQTDRPQIYNQLIIYVNFTIGSLTDGRIKVEFSHDNSSWYQEVFESVSGTSDTISLGERIMTGTGLYRIAIPIKDRYIRISAKGTGTVTNSLMAITAAIGLS